MTDTKLEQTIIGAMILEGSCAGQTISLVKEQFFTEFENRTIFRAIKALSEAHSPIDVLSVSIEVKKIDKAITAYQISTLTNGVSAAQTNPSNIEYNCRILNQLFISRELIVLGQKVQNMAAEVKSDPFEVIKFLMDEVGKLTDFTKSNIISLDEAISELIKQIGEIKRTGKQTGVTTGLEHLDAFNGGWQAPDLNIIAARPAMGKTAFALTLANNAVKAGYPVAFFSLEMSRIQLAGRVAASESEYSISSNKLGKKDLTDYEFSILGTLAGNINGSKFFIDDTPALKLIDFRHRARKLVIEGGVKLIIIDYLQLMVADGGNREQEISTISRTLKATAKELNVPIIALSQLSRKVEERANKRPNLADLRESGAIEQDADNIYFLFRPEYYDGLFPDGYYQYGNSQISIAGLLIVDAAKGRNHATGEIPLNFNGEYMMVTNLRIN